MKADLSLRVLSAAIILVFFTIYCASGMVAGARLFERTFGLSYPTALWTSACATIAYVFLGGFLAVIMVLPTIPLQMVLAQQTARALATGQHGELSGVIRLFWRGTFYIWLVAAVLALVFQRQILAAWKVENPMALYLTLPIVLLTLWMPMFWGVLQGRQNFLWLGWSMLSNGIGRFGVAAFPVLVLHAYAAGMLTGVLLGTALAFGIAASAIFPGMLGTLWWKGATRQGVIASILTGLVVAMVFIVDLLVMGDKHTLFGLPVAGGPGAFGVSAALIVLFVVSKLTRDHGKDHEAFLATAHHPDRD